MVIVLFGLVDASPRWLILGLAVAVVDPFNCHNAEWFELHKNIHISTLSQANKVTYILCPQGTNYKALSEI